MKAAIQVTSRREAELIRDGLEDPMVRACVVIIAALKALPSDRARERVLAFVTDKLAEEHETKPTVTTK